MFKFMQYLKFKRKENLLAMISLQRYANVKGEILGLLVIGSKVKLDPSFLLKVEKPLTIWEEQKICNSNSVHHVQII